MQTQNLIAAAQQLTGGLTDLGDDSILEGLNRLVDSLNREAKLNARGEKSLEAVLTNTLANRLRVQAYLAKHPQLLERSIERPTFVFGLPRTGTTLVINLLSVDPGRRCFLRWEAFDSVPPPKPGELHSGPRFEKAQAQIDMALKHAPQIAAIHYEDGDSPTECQFAMSPSFVAQYYDSIAYIPSYHSWFLNDADYGPALRYHKRLLQLLQAEARGHWTLKNPWHPLFLTALTKTYPDAQLVMTHRDPVEVLASACSLIRHVRVNFSDSVDSNAIGANMLDTFDKMIERTVAYKDRHGGDSIYDLQYAQLMRDPIGEIMKLYRHFDEPFTTEAHAAMAAFLRDNPQGKHGRHTYSLEDYGLNHEQVRARYKDYCERFNIRVKA